MVEIELFINTFSMQKRKWPDSWQAKINAFNYKYFEKHPSGPLEDRIVQGKIKFNDGKDLGFKCNEDPMCNHCDKKLCRTRKVWYWWRRSISNTI